SALGCGADTPFRPAFKRTTRRPVVYILARWRAGPINSVTARAAIRHRYGNHENANKSKGPNTGSGLDKITRSRQLRWDDLLVLLGLLLRRREAFEALQELLFGHALNGNFGIVGIDARAGGTDQRHRIGFRLVDLDELL